MNFIILFTVFGILFLGELGDKSQLIILNLVLEMDTKPYKIGIGATLGFATIVTLGIIFGNVILQFIPVTIIAIISGSVFIIVGVIETRKLKDLYYEMKNPGRNAKKIEKKKSSENEPKNLAFEKFRKNPYLAGFFSIFIMELGDKTQILTISLASLYAAPFEVWLGSFIALSGLVWIGIFFGAIILKYIPKFYIKVVAILVFLIIGIIVIISNLI
ncbi:MAG: hypothetical protein EU543_01410 [Promethearchaeota archaeon]|nr:MAG: hypothetical protein EU543_01410 [Candidatus Lokiarchaeota archaeon]